MAQSRRRLGVALVLDQPVAHEVEGLRRALGDPSLGTVVPHLTLVPPVNVRADDVAGAVEVVRRAAAAQEGPLRLRLGPVATFAPEAPVVYLGVERSSADALARLGRLRDAALRGPLRRPPRWPWVPHVTICDEATPELLAAAATVMPCYDGEVVLDRLVLLDQVERSWRPLADACLEAPAVIGRGGLELEVTRGREPGPEGYALLEQAAALPALREAGALSPLAQQAGPGWPGEEAIVLSGRRLDEGLVGLACAWWRPSPGAPLELGVYVAPPARRQGVGRALLYALEAAARSQGWAIEGAHAHGPAQFFANCSGWAGYVVETGDRRR